jgi:hypothetical protein
MYRSGTKREGSGYRDGKDSREGCRGTLELKTERSEVDAVTVNRVVSAHSFQTS